MTVVERLSIWAGLKACATQRWATAVVVAVALLSHCQPAIAAEDPAVAAPMRATRLAKPPAIDGILDDEAWKGEPLPAGDVAVVQPAARRPDRATDDRVGRLRRRCPLLRLPLRRPGPGRIKTSITRRDNIWGDDWVGLSLDALGTGQASYHLMVNPSGIQLDMINTIAGNEDTSPDWIWDSAGRVNDRGYAVEIRLPLQHPLQGRRRRATWASCSGAA